MAKKYIVTGFVFRGQRREILSKPFKTKKQALTFKRNKNKELKTSISKFQFAKDLKIVSFDTGFPEKRFE